MLGRSFADFIASRKLVDLGQSLRDSSLMGEYGFLYLDHVHINYRDDGFFEFDCVESLFCILDRDLRKVEKQAFNWAIANGYMNQPMQAVEL